MDSETMPKFSPTALLSMAPIEVERRFSCRDTILYNLGIGFGEVAIEDEALLQYVLEPHLTSFPTMATILAADLGLYSDPRFGIDFARVVHWEEEIEILGALPSAGLVRGVTKIDGLWDRGTDKGAVMRTSRTLTSESGESFGVCRTTTMLRGNGGFGGTSVDLPRAVEQPQRSHDGSIEVGTRPEQALIYRLSGDTNPLHSDPAIARKGGFHGPILHGLCSFGVVARAIVSALAQGDGSRLKRFGLRFAAPVYPGETLRTEYWWLDGGELIFQTRVLERDVVVLSGGRALITESLIR